MSGSIYVYVSNKNGAHKIPKPKYSNYSTNFRAIPSLANEEVLLVTLFYETLNRKPYKLDLVSFHRAKLDEHGGYKITQNQVNDSLDNFKNYAFSTADDLALNEMPIPVPVAPNNIPTTAEKDALYFYVKENYPLLWINCSYLVEQNIKDIEKHFNELRNLVKEAYNKRSKK